jgi:hypothetical protein
MKKSYSLIKIIIFISIKVFTLKFIKNKNPNILKNTDKLMQNFKTPETLSRIK